jgi:hypothetical protein
MGSGRLAALWLQHVAWLPGLCALLIQLACALPLSQVEAAAAADLVFVWKQHVTGKLPTSWQYNLGLERYR